MREYDEDDENIRLYAPVLQRVIILAAVIIAVPVMMWTITTFIRSYVERPKAPTFQHLTLTEPSQSSPPESPLTASVPPPQSAIQPGSAPILADAARTSSSADANLGSPEAPLAPPVGDAGAGPGPSSATATPVPPPNPPVAGSPAAPSAAASPAGAAPRNASTGTPASPTDPGLAWPNPKTGNAPSFGGSPPPATAETASAELPAAEPIKGHIPLPRHRPDLAIASMGPSGTATGTATGAATGAATAAATGSIAPAGHVPLPRLRPADAPADAPPAPSSPYSYQPGLDSGH